jgi:hypothetical protein
MGWSWRRSELVELRMRELGGRRWVEKALDLDVRVN